MAAAKAGVKVTFKDEGLSDFLKALADLKDKNVVVGVRGRDATKKYKEGQTVAFVAKMLEFGTENMPARPFMRETVRRESKNIGDAAADAMKDVDFRKNPENAVEQALEEVGRAASKAIVTTIDRASQWAKPDDLETQSEKGSSRPLIDTGKLRGSISWAVRDGRSVIKEGKP